MAQSTDIARGAVSEADSTNKEVLGLARYLATNVAAEPVKGTDIHLQVKLRSVLDRHRGDIAKAAEEIRKESNSFKREFPMLAGHAQQIVDALAQEMIMLGSISHALVS